MEKLTRRSLQQHWTLSGILAFSVYVLCAQSCHAGVMISMRSESPVSGSADATVFVSIEGENNDVLNSYDIVLDIDNFDLSDSSTPIEISNETFIAFPGSFFSFSQFGVPGRDLYFADGFGSAPVSISTKQDLFSFDVTFLSGAPRSIDISIDLSSSLSAIKVNDDSSSNVESPSPIAVASAIIPEPSALSTFAILGLISLCTRQRSERK